MEKQPQPRKPYTSDLTDAQWDIIEPMIPVWNVGRARTTDRREVLNAIFYVLVNGCTWRNLPHDFPPEGTVRDYFHQWRRNGLWDKMLFGRSTGNTIHYGNRFVWPPIASQRPVQAASTRRVSNPLEPPLSGVSTQEKKSTG